MSTPLISRQEHYLCLKVGRPEGKDNDSEKREKRNLVIWSLRT